MDGFRVILTEDGYTTVEGPMARSAALDDFSRWASCITPMSGSHMRVVAEPEYRRLREAGLALGDVS